MTLKVDKTQIAWLTWARLNGAQCMVVRSLEEMLEKLENNSVDDFE